MVFLTNESGFTLISSLLRIFIIVMILPMLIFILSKLTLQSMEESLSIQQLFFLIQAEINEADEVAHTQKRLYVSQHDQKITFEQYGALLRRQVNGQGHEVYHRNIKSFNIKSLPYGKEIQIRTLTGETYERIIITSKQ